MYDIAILTTAIIRPEIHVHAFSSLKRFITRDIKILWIINIDFINRFYNLYTDNVIPDNVITQSLHNTQETIKALFINYNIVFKFICNKNGNFNKAVRCIINTIKDHINDINYGILYLEDDWEIIKNTENIWYYLDRLNGVIGYKFAFGTCSTDTVSFSPTLWNISSFKKLVIQAFEKNSDINIDPERLMQNHFKTTKVQNQMKCLPNHLVALDLGRYWLKNIGLVKWNRKTVGEICYQRLD